MAHIKFLHKCFIFFLYLCFIVGCDYPQYVPVEELHPQYAMNHPVGESYIVRAGDTLYAIAFLYDRNVSHLAQINHISAPYSLRAGQVVHLGGTLPKITYHASSLKKQKSKPMLSGKWILPTSGKVERDLKGIRILGQARQIIIASQSGVVAYAGNGLPGYGQLILIKHPNNYLTAYAFNSSILVKEGDSIARGQKIATMGQLSDGLWGLHFEIRYLGEAVNPLGYLYKS